MRLRGSGLACRRCTVRHIQARCLSPINVTSALHHSCIRACFVHSTLHHNRHLVDDLVVAQKSCLVFHLAARKQKSSHSLPSQDPCSAPRPAQLISDVLSGLEYGLPKLALHSSVLTVLTQASVERPPNTSSR